MRLVVAMSECKGIGLIGNAWKLAHLKIWGMDALAQQNPLLLTDQLRQQEPQRARGRGRELDPGGETVKSVKY